MILSLALAHIGHQSTYQQYDESGLYGYEPNCEFNVPFQRTVQSDNIHMY